MTASPTLQFYEYRLQARRPATYLALGLGLFSAYAVALLAATLAIAPILAYLGILLHRLWANPTSGLIFAPAQLTLITPKAITPLRLGEIRAVRIRRGWLSDHEVTLLLTHDRRLLLPADALPPLRTLRRELARRQIPIT